MIQIRLFGAIEAVVDGRTVEGLTLKQRQVLAVLALADGAPVPREVVADRLWEGDPPRTWVGTLDSYVCVARRALHVDRGRSSPLATTEAGFVLRAEVDLVWFHRLARVATEHHSHVAVDWAREAFDLVRAEPLVEVPYAAWAAEARECFHHAAVSLALESARRANGAGDHATAAWLARSAIARDAMCEEAWVQLMLAHWLRGDTARALGAFASLRRTVVGDLGQEPGPAAQELYLTILRSAPLPWARHAGEGPERLRTLLRLLRLELEQVPGLQVPALDADLSRCAAAVLAGARGLVRGDAGVSSRRLPAQTRRAQERPPAPALGPGGA